MLSIGKKLHVRQEVSEQGEQNANNENLAVP